MQAVGASDGVAEGRTEASMEGTEDGAGDGIAVGSQIGGSPFGWIPNIGWSGLHSYGQHLGQSFGNGSLSQSGRRN